MTGLRTYARDGSLPRLLGDDELCLPLEDELLGDVRRLLLDEDAPEPLGAELLYARWKPHVSTAATWGVRLADGRTQLVAFKRYATDKAAAIAATYRPDRHTLAALQGLRASYVDPRRRVCLWTYPADRVLRGLARAVNGRRSARLVEPLLDLDELSLRRGKTHARLLRYKPERRAVLQLTSERRDGSGALTCALRVLPPAEAGRVQAARSACAPLAQDGLGPLLLGVDSSSGTLVEEWLTGQTFAPEEFAHARECGALLARLHAEPPPGAAQGAGAGPPPPPPPATGWFAFDPELERARGELVDRPHPPHAGAGERGVWIHGDLHPDQLIARPGGDLRLLDLDRLGVGDRALDLASWVADHLAARPGTGLEEALEPLLAGYREAGGRPPSPERLRTAIRSALASLAVAALRRLEADAEAKARRLVACALALDAPESGA